MKNIPVTDIPASIAPIVAVLGRERTVELLLAHGGTVVYLAARPTAHSPVAAVVGAEAAAALSLALGPGYLRIPLGKPFIAADLLKRGWPIRRIARHLRADEGRVRRWLGPAPVASRQLRMF